MKQRRKYKYGRKKEKRYGTEKDSLMLRKDIESYLGQM